MLAGQGGMSQSILVTGGAGYVGSHACKTLADAGYRPVVYDNLSRGHREAVRWGPLVEGDLHDRDRLVAALRTHRVGAVMHFAAFAYVGESVAEPEIYYRNNVGGTLALLAAMREAAVGTIVFSSTCAVYGIPDQVPIGETTAKAPLNPYGETKLAIERALHWYAAGYGLRFAALRYFNAAGADINGEIGEDHEPETHLIPRVGLLGAPGDRRSRADRRPGGTVSRDGAAGGRPTRARRRPSARPRAPRLAGAPFRSRHDHPHRAGLGAALGCPADACATVTRAPLVDRSAKRLVLDRK